MTKLNWLLVFPFLLIIPITFGQGLPSSVLYHELLKLKETKRVLYLAAHPDDENTRLIAYLANGEHAQVAYLSLTRGDGGQNLIGKELGLALGMIRTNELLKARETDGGRQFFSRAIDFGYSKNPDETLNNWEREKLLSDVVWIIRRFQPDIIINRFTTTPGTTHGQHTTSAILGVEAFSKAADPSVFPEQLESVKPWQPKRIFWNAYNWGGQYEPEEGKTYHQFPVGDYNPLLGTTYSQIAADSRTMHKSQGFGSTAQIGEGTDHIELIEGEPFDDDPFEGVPNRWNQLKEGQTIQASIDKILENFDFTEPQNNLKGILSLKKLLDSQNSVAVWLKEKQDHINQIILDLLGVRSELIVRKEIGFPGESIEAELIFNNPSEVPINVENLAGSQVIEINQTAKSNQLITQKITLEIPEDHPVSQPFWLENPLDGSHYDIRDPEKIGLPVNPYQVGKKLMLTVDGQKISTDLPVMFKYNDQVDGEVRQPFVLVPEVNVSLNKDNIYLIDGADHSLQIELTFEEEIHPGDLQFEGLKPDQYKVIQKQTDETRKRIVYDVQLLGSETEKKEVLVSYITDQGKKYNLNTNRILYKHIPNLTYFTTTSFGLINLDIKVSNQKIGYISGAGDDVPDVLRDLGYSVTYLDNSDLNKEILAEYATVIVGIRAFNVNQALAENLNQLMEYVKEGGNLIVQYNTSSPLLTRSLGPYPFSLSRDRVSVEDSPVQADLSHPVFSFPNQIQLTDFDGWVQERGLYFTSDWDSSYSTPLTVKDPDEDPKKGALLFAEYGKGTYTYSGISWFRQLPAGVPGAVKIFVNLIEQGGGK